MTSCEICQERETDNLLIRSGDSIDSVCLECYFKADEPLNLLSNQFRVISTASGRIRHEMADRLGLHWIAEKLTNLLDGVLRG